MRHEADSRAQVKRRVAEDEAKRIIEDARQDAEAFLQERIKHISELSDAVVERGEGIVMRLDRAEEVRAKLQGLADALGESAEELAREIGSAAAPERRATPEAIQAEREAVTEPEAEVVDAEIADDPTVGELADEDEDAEPAKAAVELVPDDAEEPGPREPDEQLSARLVALQMAVAGGKRSEVEVHLQRTFAIGDVSQILDDVFGTGAEGGKRAGWPSTRDGAA